MSMRNRGGVEQPQTPGPPRRDHGHCRKLVRGMPRRGGEGCARQETGPRQGMQGQESRLRTVPTREAYIDHPHALSSLCSEPSAVKLLKNKSRQLYPWLASLSTYPNEHISAVVSFSIYTSGQFQEKKKGMARVFKHLHRLQGNGECQLFLIREEIKRAPVNSTTEAREAAQFANEANLSRNGRWQPATPFRFMTIVSKQKKIVGKDIHMTTGPTAGNSTAVSRQRGGYINWQKKKYRKKESS